MGGLRYSEQTKLRRYTNLATVIDMLMNKRLVLLDPGKWDDGNDRNFMEAYKLRANLKTLVAMCFAKDRDTYHHWKVFSESPNGVCVVFHKNRLLRTLDPFEGIRHRPVQYITIKDFSGKGFRVAELPFIKRIPYKAEGEYRVIFQSEDQAATFKNFPLDLECISHIILSPWVHESQVQAIRDALKQIAGTKSFRVYQSSLVDNKAWKDLPQGLLP